MEHDPKKHLYDILQAGKLIGEFTRGRTIERYRDDIILRSAVERQFQIIGEALLQLSRRYPDVARKITDYQSIIDFRHVLVHGYDHIEDDVVWGIVEGNLGNLIREVELLLKNL